MKREPRLFCKTDFVSDLLRSEQIRKQEEGDKEEAFFSKKRSQNFLILLVLESYNWWYALNTGCVLL